MTENAGLTALTRREEDAWQTMQLAYARWVSAHQVFMRCNEELHQAREESRERVLAARRV
jgi:hypothetical protein